MKITLIAPEDDAHALALGAALEHMGHDVPRVTGLPGEWMATPPEHGDAHLPWLSVHDLRTPSYGRLQAALVLEAAGSRPLVRAATLLRAADRATTTATLRARGLPTPATWVITPEMSAWPYPEGPLLARPRYGHSTPAALVTSLAAARDAVGMDVAGGGILQEPYSDMPRVRVLTTSTHVLDTARYLNDAGGGIWERPLIDVPDSTLSVARQAVGALGDGVMCVEIAESPTGTPLIIDVRADYPFDLGRRDLAVEVAAALLRALDRPGDRFARRVTLSATHR